MVGAITAMSKAEMGNASAVVGKEGGVAWGGRFWDLGFEMWCLWLEVGESMRKLGLVIFGGLIAWF